MSIAIGLNTEATEHDAVSVMPVKSAPVFSLSACEALDEGKC